MHTHGSAHARIFLLGYIRGRTDVWAPCSTPYRTLWWGYETAARLRTVLLSKAGSIRLDGFEWFQALPLEKCVLESSQSTDFSELSAVLAGYWCRFADFLWLLAQAGTFITMAISGNAKLGGEDFTCAPPTPLPPPPLPPNSASDCPPCHLILQGITLCQVPFPPAVALP